VVSVSSDNYYVVRKNPKGGFSYVQGFESDPENYASSVFVDIPVTDVSKVYDTYDECLEAALEDYSEYGVVTHPECSLDEALSHIKAFEETEEYWDDNGVQLKKGGKIVRNPVFELNIRAAEITE
jgi:hypothetical protein